MQPTRTIADADAFTLESLGCRVIDAESGLVEADRGLGFDRGATESGAYHLRMLSAFLRTVRITFLIGQVALCSIASAQVESLDDLFGRVDPLPFHPEFEDPISEDSPNAVGRHLWYHKSVGWQTLSAAGVVAIDLSDWRVPEELWDDLGIEAPDVDVWRDWLSQHRAWTDEIVAATRLKTFDPYWNPDPRAVYKAEGDERERLRSACSRLLYVLRDDAIRLWLEGEYEASIDRMEGMIRIGLQFGNEKATVLQSMIAGELVERGLELIRAAYFADITNAEAQRLQRICLLVPTHDPVSIRETWYRDFEARRLFVEQQLETVGGGDALWLRVGQQMFFREALKRSVFSQNPGPTYAVGFVLREGMADPPFYQLLAEGAPIKEAAQRTDDRLEGVTHQALVEAYESAWRLAYDVYMSWDDPSTRSDAIWADDFAKDDPTQIAYLMMGPVRGPWQASQDVINARNATIATYAGADPLP